jgi:cyanophycinase
VLALVGSGEYLPAMEPVDRYLLDLLGSHPRVACLPTAAGSESPERIRYWSDLGLEHFRELGARVESVPIIDHHSANDPTLASHLHGVDFIYMSGGNPGYLYTTLRDSLAWQEILAVHRSGGLVAGCSAGAMVMGEYLPSLPRSMRAFGLIQGAMIMPHLDEIPAIWLSLFRSIFARKKILLGIEGNTALLVQTKQHTILGSGRVLFWHRQKRVYFREGTQIDSFPNLASNS